MTDHETYRELTAGFVLGVLDPMERRDFEAHMAKCSECRRDVASFAPIPSLLSRADHLAIEPLPQAVADRAAARARAEWSALARSRRWWRLAAAAAALIAVAVAAVALFSGSAGPSATVLAIESPIVTGEVTIDARTWGTAVHLELEGLPQRDRYVAWVVDDGGNRQQAATWGPTPTGAARLDGASSTPTDRVTAVVVTDATGDETLLTAISG